MPAARMQSLEQRRKDASARENLLDHLGGVSGVFCRKKFGGGREQSGVEDFGPAVVLLKQVE